jgi:hypothetical protein
MPTPTPCCHNMSEHPSAHALRENWDGMQVDHSDPIAVHVFVHGLAYTVGSAVGRTPPSEEEALAAFVVPNTAGLTAGARAWSKHFHRSARAAAGDDDDDDDDGINNALPVQSWWGTPSGPIADINTRALELYHRISDGASWRNLHWLPHSVLVYEMRVPEGYGMRWAQDWADELQEQAVQRPWIFRGFVEPMVENGHEVGWKH